MVKRIISDSLVDDIIKRIQGLDKRQAIDEIIVTENVKESTAKRYVRYAKWYIINVKVKMYPPPPEDVPVEMPSWFEPIKKLITGRRKRRTKGRKYFTHIYEFVCLLYPDTPLETVLVHRYMYTSHNRFASDSTARDLHLNSYGDRHIVISVRHVETLTPS